MGDAQLSLDAATTALVLVDLQEFTNGLPTVPLGGKAVIEAAARLADGFRSSGALVVHVTASLGVGGGVVLLRPSTDRPTPALDLSPGWDTLAPGLGPDPGDVVVTKWGWDGFFGTDLDVQLRRRGVTTLAVGGIATNFGVESTARHAYELGYEQVFVNDALAAFTAEEHEMTLTRVLPRLGRVRNVDAVLDALAPT